MIKKIQIYNSEKNYTLWLMLLLLSILFYSLITGYNQTETLRYNNCLFRQHQENGLEYQFANEIGHRKTTQSNLRIILVPLFKDKELVSRFYIIYPDSFYVNMVYFTIKDTFSVILIICQQFLSFSISPYNYQYILSTNPTKRLMFQ